MIARGLQYVRAMDEGQRFSHIVGLYIILGLFRRSGVLMDIGYVCLAIALISTASSWLEYSYTQVGDGITSTKYSAASNSRFSRSRELTAGHRIRVLPTLNLLELLALQVPVLVRYGLH